MKRRQRGNYLSHAEKGFEKRVAELKVLYIIPNKIVSEVECREVEVIQSITYILVVMPSVILQHRKDLASQGVKPVCGQRAGSGD